MPLLTNTTTIKWNQTANQSRSPLARRWRPMPRIPTPAKVPTNTEPRNTKWFSICLDFLKENKIKIKRAPIFLSPRSNKIKINQTLAVHSQSAHHVLHGGKAAHRVCRRRCRRSNLLLPSPRQREPLQPADPKTKRKNWDERTPNPRGRIGGGGGGFIHLPSNGRRVERRVGGVLG